MMHLCVRGCLLSLLLSTIVAGCAAGDPSTEDGASIGEPRDAEDDEAVAMSEQAATSATYHCVAIKSIPSCGRGKSKYSCRRLNGACSPSFTTSCRTYNVTSYYLYAC